MASEPSVESPDGYWPISLSKASTLESILSIDSQFSMPEGSSLKENRKTPLES